MSFRCESCGTAQPAKAKPVRIPVKFRPAVYPLRVHLVEGREKVMDQGGNGLEISHEVNLCQQCHQKWLRAEGPLWALLTSEDLR